MSSERDVDRAIPEPGESNIPAPAVEPAGGDDDDDGIAGAPAVPPSFAVVDAATANWVVRRILEARAYAERVRRWAELELRRAEREESFFVRRFGGELEAWARSEVARLTDGRRSVRLPSGVVGFRTAPPSLQVVDESALLAWARRHLRDAVEVRTTLRKSVLLGHLKATGECPTGASLAGGDERFYVR